MRTPLFPVAILSATLLLAACVAPEDASQPTGAGPVKAAVGGAGSGPAVGNTVVPGKQAFDLFETVCLKTLPRFKGAQAAALKVPTFYNSDVGVYVHRRLNLSFKIVEGPRPVCSMVFASRDNAQMMTLAFTMMAAVDIGAERGHGNMATTTGTAQAPNGTLFMFEPMPPQGGVPLYHAYVAVKG